MKTRSFWPVVSVVVFGVGSVFAQASMGAGPGMMHGGGYGARSGMDYTPGWSMLTATERKEHQERMRSMKTYEECKTYMDQHRELMTERAKEKGRGALAQPRRDACAAINK
jgi:hypothetical protein